MGRTYKFYISGSVSEGFFQKMWEELPQQFNPGDVTLSNPIRNNTETTFEMFIANDDGSNPSFDYAFIVDSSKEWIVNNSVYYEQLDVGV